MQRVHTWHSCTIARALEIGGGGEVQCFMKDVPVNTSSLVSLRCLHVATAKMHTMITTTKMKRVRYLGPSRAVPGWHAG